MRPINPVRTAAKVIISLLLLGSSTVFSQVTTLWVAVDAGSTNSWGVATNWNFGVPDTTISGSITNVAVITNRVASYTVQYDTTTSQFNRLALGGGTNLGSGTLTLNVATNNQATPVTMVITNLSGAALATSALQLTSGGVLNVNTNGTLYYRGGFLQGTAQFNINGGAVVMVRDASAEGVQTRLAFNSVFNLNSGTFSISAPFQTPLQVGANNSVDNPTANFNGGTASFGPLVIGARGTGTVNVAGGVISTTGSISLSALQSPGAQPIAVGLLNVSGGVINNTGSLALGDTTNKVGQTAAAVLTMTGGVFNQGNQTRVGDRNTGRINLSGGTFNNAGNFYLGYAAETATNLAGVGTLTVSGSGEMNIANGGFSALYIGGPGYPGTPSGGTGIVEVTSGRLTAETVLFNLGTFTVSGGTAVVAVAGNNGTLVIGNGSNGCARLNITGGLLSNNLVAIGRARSTNNLVTASGGTWLVDSNLDVEGSYNQIMISNGAQVLVQQNAGPGGTRGFALSSSISSNNNVIVTGLGTVLRSGAEIRCGDAGDNNTLLVTDSAMVTNIAGAFIGTSGSGNRVIVTNGAAWNAGGFLNLGHSSGDRAGVYQSSSGNCLLVGGGGIVRVNELQVGKGTNGVDNTVLVSGPGSELLIGGTSGLSLGGGQTGHLLDTTASSSNSVTIDNGATLDVTNAIANIYIGLTNNSTGNRLVITNGGIARIVGAAGKVIVGNATNALGNLLKISGGSMFITNSFNSAVLEVSRGAVQLDSGTLTANRLIMTNVDAGGLSAVAFNGGVLNIRTTQVANGFALIVGDGVSAATLNLQGGGHIFTDGLIVTNNATLQGTGTITAATTIHGTLAPGSSVGTLNNSGAVILASTAVLNYELGASNDLTVVTGNLTLDGTVNITDAGGFGVGTYTLISYTGSLINNGLVVGTTPNPSLAYTIDVSTAGLVKLNVTSGAGDPFATWQNQYFGGTNCASCGGAADFDGDGVSNTNEFLAGFNPTNSAAYAHVISVVKSSSDIQVTYLGANGNSTMSPSMASRTNVLEYMTGNPNGSYSTNFTSSGQTNILSGGTGLGIVTNMLDAGGATNAPSRYYRVRVLAP
jgi:fibronectin-binding autotransporter adhesin